MDQSPLNIDIRRLRDLPLFKKSIGLDNDFFISDIVLDDQIRKELAFPCRFDGFLAVFCLEGQLKVELDLKTYDISEGSLLINIPGSIFRCYADTTGQPIRLICVWMSSDFAGTSIRFDFVRLFEESSAMMENPCIKLNEKERATAARYLQLAGDVMRMDFGTKRESVGALISSFFHIMGSIWTRNLDEAKRNASGSTPRTRLLFNQFLRLVAENHTQRRDMRYYAERLCLTPKYLSKVIKQVSGRSAPEWIDAFVVLEAKNMLRYSDMAIKEIVYTLHFPNQSVFYKFFKSHTGQTPSEYRRS